MLHAPGLLLKCPASGVQMGGGGSAGAAGEGSPERDGGGACNTGLSGLHRASPRTRVCLTPPPLGTRGQRCSAGRTAGAPGSARAPGRGDSGQQRWPALPRAPVQALWPPPPPPCVPVPTGRRHPRASQVGAGTRMLGAHPAFSGPPGGGRGPRAPHRAQAVVGTFWAAARSRVAGPWGQGGSARPTAWGQVPVGEPGEPAGHGARWPGLS